jgi:hypothetical protein
MRTAFIAASAGVAVASAAQAEPPAWLDHGPGIAGHVYVNAASGEVVLTRGGVGPRGQEASVWANDRSELCGLGGLSYALLRDSATKLDTWWLDWGDVESNSVVDSISFTYSTDVADPGGDGEDGFAIDLSFFDGVDVAQIPDGLEPFIVYSISGLPGGASGAATWLVTLDLAGGIEFEIGDSDGVDNSGNGFHSVGDGQDLDGDGLSDFAFGFNVKHPLIGAAQTSLGMIGPSDEAPGDVDQSAWFAGSWSSFQRFWDFGGVQCSDDPFLRRPWSTAYIVLYGPIVDPNCEVDTNDDGTLDFFDIQVWLGWFSAHDPRADMNDDGVFDFFDAQVFLGLFSAGCP